MKTAAVKTEAIKPTQEMLLSVIRQSVDEMKGQEHISRKQLLGALDGITRYLEIQADEKL